MNRKNQSVAPWYQLSPKDIEENLQSKHKVGLSHEEAKKRLEKFGPNKLKEADQDTIFDRIINQLKSPLVVILLIAGSVTFFLHEYVDLLVIFIALLINVVIGVIQEDSASNAFDALVKSQEKIATVKRDGHRHQIPAEELVPGDIVILSSGTYIPADIRIIEQNNLSVNESALTGEWVDISKKAHTLKKDGLRITEQDNMLWMGTLIVSGAGVGVVVETGEDTEFGAIAKELANPNQESIPLQRNIDRIAKFLAAIVIISIVLIFIGGILRGNPISEILLTSIAIAVAVMPEGLPAAVTVVLALGMKTILKKGGLVRNLLAAETLGNTTVILTDKTGTLTQAKMEISDIVTVKSLEKNTTRLVTAHQGAFKDADKKDVLSMAVLTSDAYIENKEDPLAEWIIRGNPVERAIIGAGLKTGLSQKDLLTSNKRLDFLPFESKRRFVASLNTVGKTKKGRIYITGSPDLILKEAAYVYLEGKKKKLTKSVRESLIRTQLAESATGMRMVAVAYTDTSWTKFTDSGEEDPSAEIIKDTVFCGLLTLHDPIREDVPQAIETARQAGTKVIMLTGDNPITALKIAEKSGIIDSGEDAITGAQIEKLSDKELLLALKRRHVFARVLPSQKLRISRLLKSQGEIVAMTGDGINDSPALQSADIGIALGSGTEVAKEASDLVLLSDSFSIIVEAIREGRRIRDNLKKIVTYLVSTSFSVLLVVGAALVMASPLPILATQILWINIIEEGFMNFAFAFEPAEKGVMKRDPRHPSMKQILTPNLLKLIAIIAIVTGALLLVIYFTMLKLGYPIETIRTYVFIALSIDSIFFTFSIKNLHRPLWKIDLTDNRYLLYAFMGSTGALAASLLLPPLRTMLQLEPLTLNGVAFMIGMGILNLIIIEFAKFLTFGKVEHNT